MECKICGKMFELPEIGGENKQTCSDICAKKNVQRIQRNSRKRCYANNLEFYKKQQRDKNRELKILVINHYGGKCVCCGESFIEFLAIDHINGGGNQHRKEIKKVGTHFYRWLKNENFPDGYQVLCHNCNQSIGLYGYCPHDRIEEEK